MEGAAPVGALVCEWGRGGKTSGGRGECPVPPRVGGRGPWSQILGCEGARPSVEETAGCRAPS